MRFNKGSSVADSVKKKKKRPSGMASNSGKTDLHIGFQIQILLSSSQ